jgi:hypothetical protein
MHLPGNSEFDDKIALADIDSPLPQGIPMPPLWKLAVIPVRLRKMSKGGIILTDDSATAALWHHQLFKIAAIGSQVYKGKAYESYDLAEDDYPKVGELWLVDPKQPRRYEFRGTTIVIINDDQLLSRVDPAMTEHLKFNGLEL